jgi:hypothetical protein
MFDNHVMEKEKEKERARGRVERIGRCRWKVRTAESDVEEDSVRGS